MGLKEQRRLTIDFYTIEMELGKQHVSAAGGSNGEGDRQGGPAYGRIGHGDRHPQWVNVPIQRRGSNARELIELVDVEMV